MYYGKECMEDYDYWHQAHEIEAREQEERLYVEYLYDELSDPVQEVAQFFGNRLCSAV